MLPYTPLHHLLLDAVGGRPLVMTSGNLSDEPIATDNAEALDRLSSIADAFLLHDRAILSRYDDSVLRVVDGLVEPVRRSRGYAPFPLALPFETDVDILAAGPEQKNTFTLLTGGYAFVSQHIGDMENAETLDSFEATEQLYERLFRISPELVAHDLHPEYLSTKWALELDLPKVGVQHHHAHIVSVTAENNVSERVVGIAFDGTGYGEDGRIWGGEVLLADWASYERFAHLAYVPMPGGAGAIKRPARMALGTLSALGLLDHPGAAPLRSRLAENEEATLLRMVERGVNCPLTSSMGRLFDTVAALIGVADDARYEGEAAILLEAAADRSAEGAYEFGFVTSDTSPLTDLQTPLTLDPTPVLAGPPGRHRSWNTSRGTIDAFPPLSGGVYSPRGTSCSSECRHALCCSCRRRVHEPSRSRWGRSRTARGRAGSAQPCKAARERRCRVVRAGRSGVGQTARDLML